MTPSPAHLNGLLAVDKPTGLVSKDVSRWLQKRLGKLRIGHVGTLDPAASGVLPILLGRATRLQDYLLEMPKTYEFDISFGSETDTLDSDGKVVREAAFEHVTAPDLTAAMLAFTGDFSQIPPIYSAVKYKGKPLYDYARGGEESAASVPLESLQRQVRVSRFDLLAFEPGKGSFRLTCSKGTYVRSLVKDVAEKVGTCGTLTRLVRTSAAGVDLTQAHGLEQIEQNLGVFSSLVVPVEQLNLGIAKWQSPRPALTSRLLGGQQVAMELAEYLNCLKSSAGAEGKEGGPVAAVPGGLAEPLLLINDRGEAFGIGSVRRQSPSEDGGRVVIVMKRGL